MKKAIPAPSKTLFPEWAAAHQEVPAYPAIIQDMWQMNGKKADECCGTCIHLHRWKYHSGSYNKCDQTKITHGPATDFRVGWPACGKHQKEGQA